MKRTGLDLVEETGSFVMPGDEFQIPDGDSSKLILGPGLKLINNRGAEGGRIVACKPGVLTKIKGNTFFVLVKAKQVNIGELIILSCLFLVSYLLFLYSMTLTRRTIFWV